MRNTIYLFTALAILVPAAGMACSGTYACNGVYVDTLYSNNSASANVYIYTSGNEQALTGCDGSTNYLLLYVDTDAGKAIYANLLVAVTANRKIDIVLNNDGNQCEVKFVRFRRE